MFLDVKVEISPHFCSWDYYIKWTFYAVFNILEKCWLYGIKFHCHWANLIECIELLQIELFNHWRSISFLKGISHYATLVKVSTACLWPCLYLSNECLDHGPFSFAFNVAKTQYWMSKLVIKCQVMLVPAKKNFSFDQLKVQFYRGLKGHL